LQWIAQAAEEVRRRLTQRVMQKIEPAEPVRQTEKIEQGEKIAPTVTVEETPGQKLRRRIEQERQRQQQQRRSGGIRI
jgi:hypothetical protein